jgi:hypothetical protein
MTAYPESQASGNHWSQAASPMAHEGLYSRDQRDVRRMDLADLGQQMSSFSAGDAVIPDLRRKFVIYDEPFIVSFLRKHRALAQLLVESVNPLQMFLGRDTMFVLKIRFDEAGMGTLYAVTLWPGDVGSVREALTRFDNDWWATRSQQASGRLAFTYELV